MKMLPRPRRSAIASAMLFVQLALFVCTTTLRASDYTFTRIDVPGAAGTIGQGINNQGDLGGNSFA